MAKVIDYFKSHDDIARPCMIIDLNDMMELMADIRVEAALVAMYKAGSKKTGHLIAQMADPNASDKALRAFNDQANAEISADLKVQIAGLSPLQGNAADLLEEIRQAMVKNAGSTFIDGNLAFVKTALDETEVLAGLMTEYGLIFYTLPDKTLGCMRVDDTDPLASYGRNASSFGRYKKPEIGPNVFTHIKARAA